MTEHDHLSTLESWQGQVGPGWAKLLAELHAKLTWLAEAQGCKFRVDQIKEKFGTLRFYASCTDIMQDCISAAEQRSSRICEGCGDYGTLRKKGWFKTLCNKCDAERPYRV